MFSQQFLFSFIILFLPTALNAVFLWFLKRMGVFFEAISPVRAKATTDAPFVGPFCCSLEIGSCLFAQPRHWRQPTPNESYRASATGKVLISEITQTKEINVELGIG